MDLADPFAAFAPPIGRQTPLRAAITAARLRDEPAAIGALLEAASLDPKMAAAVRGTASRLVAVLRGQPRAGGVEGLMREYALSSQEGIALMCLAEALLRIPDDATRDALIRDKLADGDWRAHVGAGRSVFVNAATWGLVVTGQLVGSLDDSGLGAALTRLIARAGQPVIRRGVDLAMRMVGEQFVTGETIAQALARAEKREAEGFRYSYDMLGEAATTSADAARYYADYANAIHAIGAAAGRRGPYKGPGISIKLSALHPRYARAQADRVMAELLPAVRRLALLARSHDIGFNIDAEEQDRLELSLDILESLALDPDLAGWDGLGFVVQAYGKRCPGVIDWIVDLARRAERRIMVRLVKGAYWDAEIKRAQVGGLADFPVYTRKVHTDVAYLACARRLLDAADAVFPQFATHNAQTLATIYHLAGTDSSPDRYEFQCLHGMGEPLYEQVVGADGLDRPCRIYAPVGTHETLLAYLVRRLLENGANSSFVHRIADPAVPLDDLIADPVEVVRAMAEPGGRHERIALPSRIYPDWPNSSGIDLTDEQSLAALTQVLRDSAATYWFAGPAGAKGPGRLVRNPADLRDRVGHVVEASEGEARAVAACAAASAWGGVAVAERAAILARAADLFETHMGRFIGLAIREAGKSAANALGEVREAVDFLRYYAVQARDTLGAADQPLGAVVCISPWNFPLAIFTGQIAAALAAGNPVLAKPAEETPLIAAEAVRLLHQAGVPHDALHLVPGDGRIGAALVGAEQVAAVMFTGSTEVARLIQRQLAQRLSVHGQPIPLIAETGGQNAMIVDSSALSEQVVADAVASAFDSAGQRCSALRILCLQEEIADRTLDMLKGALAELAIGRPDRLATDIGPVITAEAKETVGRHIAAMRRAGHRVTQPPLPPEAAHGTFVAPAIIEIDRIEELKREVFGPVLHVVRYRRERLDRLIEDINATGYGLTFGLQTRLDTMIAEVTERIDVGNVYINRNIIGAVVGVQPFGGRGLSGTGPKAGGPLCLGRLVATPPTVLPPSPPPAALLAFADWLAGRGADRSAALACAYGRVSPLGFAQELPGPVGELNRYVLKPRGHVRMEAQSEEGLWAQVAAVLASGNGGTATGQPLPADLPPVVKSALEWRRGSPFAAVLVDGDDGHVSGVLVEMAKMDGPIVTVCRADASQTLPYPVQRLVEEVSISINTTAAGGNASLMAIG
ncbi:MAG: bifunctional proline dehydrogenase/L-glutamate gamma-semialdehyde dehydrogenase PutA [Novosphingobium sp.]